MKILTLTVLAGAALLAAGCVAVPIGTQTGGEFPQPAASGSLAGAVAGQAFTSTANGDLLNLWSDGTYTLTAGNQQQFGTWRTNESSVSMCFTGNMAAYAGGNCIRVRYDGDFLELYDVAGAFVVQSWAVN